MNGETRLWRWAGAELPVATQTPGLTRWLESFTGLSSGPCPADAFPEIRQTDGRTVLVGTREWQFLQTHADCRTWLALTLSDELGRKSGAVLLHGAAWIRGAGVTVVCGQPWAGKSSTALLALRRGLRLLGDDLVRVLPDGAGVSACPRPAKRRRVPGLGLQWPSACSGTLWNTDLGNDPAELVPRLPDLFAPVDASWPVERIIHLERSDAAGFQVAPLDRAAALAAMIRQVRCGSPQFFRPMVRALDPLADRPHFNLRVGPGALEAAFDGFLNA
jgi:hypothetical protein